MLGYIFTIFFFKLYVSFINKMFSISFRHMGPYMGAKLSKVAPASRLIPCFKNISWIFISMDLTIYFPYIWNLASLKSLHVFVFLDMRLLVVVHGSENFKTLLFLQITSEWFRPTLDLFLSIVLANLLFRMFGIAYVSNCIKLYILPLLPVANL